MSLKAVNIVIYSIVYCVYAMFIVNKSFGCSLPVVKIVFVIFSSYYDDERKRFLYFLHPAFPFCVQRRRRLRIVYVPVRFNYTLLLRCPVTRQKLSFIPVNLGRKNPSVLIIFFGTKFDFLLANKVRRKLNATQLWGSHSTLIKFGLYCFSNVPDAGFWIFLALSVAFPSLSCDGEMTEQGNCL